MSVKEKSSGLDRRRFWRRVIEACQESDLAIAAFCKKEGLSEAAYYYWRRKLTDADSKSDKKTAPAFIEVARPRSPVAAFELVLFSGTTLRINPGVDRQALSNVLSVLREAGLC